MLAAAAVPNPHLTLKAIATILRAPVPFECETRWAP